MRKRHDVGIAHYFLGDTASKTIYANLDSYGFNVRLKKPAKYREEEVVCPECDHTITPAREGYKADVDSYLTLQVMTDMDSFGKAVLITSDGDYDELVKRLLNQDKLKVVFAPCKEGCSGLLVSAARGRIAFLDEFRGELEKR